MKPTQSSHEWATAAVEKTEDTKEGGDSGDGRRQQPTSGGLPRELEEVNI